MICKCSVMPMFKKAAAFACGGTLRRCIAATCWPWVRLPGKRNPHFHSNSSPPQRSRKRVVLLGGSNFLMAEMVPSDEHKPGIRLSQSLPFYKGNGCLFDNNSSNPLLVIFTTDCRGAKISSLICIQIFSSLKTLWSAGRRTVHLSQKALFFMCVSYVFKSAHTRSGFMNGTIADEDGCSGLERLKDYVNGSPQREISQ